MAGIDVPNKSIERFSEVAKDMQAEEGITIAVVVIERLKQIKGVAGFYIMATEWEEKIPKIVERSGFNSRLVLD